MISPDSPQGAKIIGTVAVHVIGPHRPSKGVSEKITNFIDSPV